MPNDDIVEGADLPANSFKARSEGRVERKKEEEAPRSALTRVVKGSITIKKKSWWNKVTEAFVGNDDKSVGEYILYDVLIPAAKNTISDMVTGGIEMILYGDSRRNDRGRRDGGRTIVDYGGRYRSQGGPRRVERAEPTTRGRVLYRFDDVVIPTRGEAEDVLSTMVEQIDRFGEVTVPDFYDLVGITDDNYTSNRYGWIDLRDTSIRPVRNGYVLTLPRAAFLD